MKQGIHCHFHRKIYHSICFCSRLAFVPFTEEGCEFGKPELDFNEYLSKHGPVIGSNYVAPHAQSSPHKSKKCVEEIRGTELIVQCDEKFTNHRLAQMNMIKNVQCERILGFEEKWEFY